MRRMLWGAGLAAALTLAAVPAHAAPAEAARAGTRTGGVDRISTGADGAQLAMASRDGNVSADGRYAAFGTLGPGEGCPATFSTCLYVKDLRTGALTKLPGTGVYAGGAIISADGRRVAFDTGNRFMKPYVHDRATGVTQPLWPADPPSGMSYELGHVAAISADGDHVAYTVGNRNGSSSSPYLYVRDLATGTDDLITPVPEGNVVGARLSADGRRVAYGVHNGDRTAVQVKDRVTGTVRRIDVAPDGTPADDVSFVVGFSADGRRVLFDSWATNLLPGGPAPHDEQAYVADLRTGRIERVGAPGDVAQAVDGGCRFVVVKEHGALPPEEQGDLVLVDVRTGRRETVAPSAASATAVPGAVTRHGRAVLFTSAAADLVPGDTNGVSDVFERHLDRRLL